jgi:AraC-like DNA-binding protein
MTPAQATTLSFSTADLPERDRLAMWREVYSRTIFKVDAEAIGDEPFRCDAKLWALPSLSFASITMSRSRVVRTRATAAQSADMMAITMMTEGTGVASHLGRDAVVGNGDGILVTSAEPGTLEFPSMTQRLSIAIPSRLLLPMIDRGEDALMRLIPRDTGALRMLAGYVGLILRDHALASPELQNHAVSHVHDLIALAIGATRDAAEVAKGRGVRAARLRAIKQDIADNLDRADLSAVTIAARQRCSPRYIQMLFESEGITFTEHLLTQRLARAHRMLTDSRRRAEKISTIAFDAGFNDLSYFNRAFRRRFGATPSDVRAQRGTSN